MDLLPVLARLVLRLVLRLGVALLPAAGLLVVAAPPAAACSCAGDALRDQVARADTVLVGTLVGTEDAAGWRWYDLEVTDVLKGVAGPRAEVRSEESGASCGLEGMRTGTAYVVLAADGHASLCGGTAPARPAYVAQVATLTGPPRPPAAEGPAALEPGRDRDGGPLAVAAVTGAGGLLAVGALLVVRRARRRRAGDRPGGHAVQ